MKHAGNNTYGLYSYLLDGEALFIKRAKITLPYLTRLAYAGAGEKIYYSDLAKMINIPNPRNLNRILGKIGSVLIELSTLININIPPIQCLVVNKRDGLPGDGIGDFITVEDYKSLNNIKKEKIVNLRIIEISSFNNWNYILNLLGLYPVEANYDLIITRTKSLNIRGGESKEHKELKKYLLNNPKMLNLKMQPKDGILEYRFPSLDSIDIYFSKGNNKIGIEVKSKLSPIEDIVRGLFQCVKYKHLIEAEEKIKGISSNVKVILALENKFPKELEVMKNILGIEVFDDIKIPND